MATRTRLHDFVLGAACAAAVAGWWVRAEPVRADEQTAQESAEYVVRTQSSSSGTALVFVLNTRTQVLGLYEAEGGSRATRGLSFVASRKIARDIHVTGYNDRSEYSYQELLKRFEVEEMRQNALQGSDQGGTQDKQNKQD